GVAMEHDQGLIAHSDGDVLLHALCDAILAAAALGDIARHFPDTSADLKGIDSRILLRQVMHMVREKGLSVVNADSTIIAQTPKLAPHIDRMRANIAEDLQLAESQVNIKATTTEGMGYAGRGEGIAAHAVVLLGG
ncbi:MAG: 2-C-methyl-D-erythritol 2,4-cyclodiphosphate synthase, partial [bacterium]|nr:2-C-methyl-D-erythritol 2,4-cyclodiphosphate synthase [bacterium]